MGNYEPGKIPSDKLLSPSWLFKELLKLKQAVNFLDDGNFPSQLDASKVLAPGTVSLQNMSGKGEWRIPILGLATAWTTTSTALVNVGPYAYFDILRWAGVTAGQVLLELTAGPSNALAQAIFELHDSQGALANLTISEVGLNWVTQPFSRLPTSSGTLVLKVRTTNASYPAQVLGANILIRP